MSESYHTDCINYFDGEASFDKKWSMLASFLLYFVNYLFSMFLPKSQRLIGLLSSSTFPFMMLIMPGYLTFHEFKDGNRQD